MQFTLYSLTIDRRDMGCDRQRLSCNSLKVKGVLEEFDGQYTPVKTGKGMSTVLYKKNNDEKYMVKLMKDGRFVIRLRFGERAILDIVKGKHKLVDNLDFRHMIIFSN